MKIECVDCGKLFEFTEGEQNFYKEKGFEKPKRCKKCRKYYTGINLGVKPTSFYDNAMIFGMPVNVEGGLSIEHSYFIQINKDDKRHYIRAIDNKYFALVRELKEATPFRSDQANMLMKAIIRKGSVKKESVKIITRSHYEGIRG